MTANAVRLQLHALAYDMANLFCTLVLPDEVERWSLTTLRGEGGEDRCQRVPRQALLDDAAVPDRVRIPAAEIP